MTVNLFLFHQFGMGSQQLTQWQARGDDDDDDDQQREKSGPR